MKSIVKWVGLGLGTGLSPKAPGTMGSLLAVILSGFIGFLHNPYFLFFSSIVGIFICELSERELGIKDDGRIVFDEIVGQWIAVASFSGYYLVLGFVFFRFFDILKPPPIRQLQELHGGFGIMIDDILAGLMSWILLVLIRIIL